MFDIVTIEPQDGVVELAINTIIKRSSQVLKAPAEGYRVIAVNDCLKTGNGGSSVGVLAIVGHAGPDSISEKKTWSGYVEEVTASTDPAWRASKKSVYLVACSTADEGTKFAYGNIANEIKTAFEGATVWASTTAVDANTLEGDWIQV